ncbi:MAG: B12-binding domain-containing radical SAM protein [Flavobacteriales bacterium]
MSKLLFSHSYFYKMDPKQWKTGMPYPPLGTITAAAFMKEKGHEVSLFDVGLKASPAEIQDVIEKEQPDFFVIYDDGFNYLTKMCLTNMREAAFEMIKIGKVKGCKIIVSSSDSTDHFERYLEAGADVILLGEGELSLLETIEAMNENRSLDHQKGIVYKDENGIKNNGRREVIRDLDLLPQAKWDLVEVEAYRKAWTNPAPFALNIATTRGCPYKCNWCAKPIYGNRYNSRSPQHVVKEIKYLSDNHQVTNFWMCDDIFGLKPNWVQEFDRCLAEQQLNITYKIQSRADLLLKENSIDALVSSGLKEVWIGAESGSQGILDAMDKGTTIEQIEESTKLLQAKGVRVAFFIQYGYSGETKADIDKTIALIKRAKPDDIGISVSYPLPGTKFYEKVKAQFKDKQNWTDSNDLSMMFLGTFNQAFYRKLHSYTHKVFQKTKGIDLFKTLLKHPSKLNPKALKTLLKTPIYAVLAWKERLELSKLNHNND